MNTLRLVVAVAIALVMAATVAHAQPTPLNGSVGVDNQLVWSNGGGDPLHSHLRADGFRQALALPGLNLSAGLQSAIRSAILTRAPDDPNVDLRRYQDQTIEGVMLSGSGWLAVNPTVDTASWTVSTYSADTWFVTYTNPTGVTERWMVIAVDICGNLILVPLTVALPCICNPAEDICGT
jgi:hypothetical protein